MEEKLLLNLNYCFVRDKEMKQNQKLWKMKMNKTEMEEIRRGLCIITR